jgi:trans-2,3-dihydro-3-hydroxyanthranilate isomerase
MPHALGRPWIARREPPHVHVFSGLGWSAGQRRWHVAWRFANLSRMPVLDYQVCDVFTDRPLAGNPLAVFTHADQLDAELMQALARELNLSECAFVLRSTRADADARVRIFTPKMELPFAGHPILGAAFVLAAPLLAPRRISLETARGNVPVRLAVDANGVGFGWMTQPLPSRKAFEAGALLLAALGVNNSALPLELYDNGPRHVFVELETAAEVAALRPDLVRLAELGSLAISVFARVANGWKTRVFAPGEGIPEDPATGAAAGPFVLHLARHGRVQFGEEVVIHQGAELGRPSTLHARVDGSQERLERIEVGGNAVLIASGQFRLP